MIENIKTARNYKIFETISSQKLRTKIPMYTKKGTKWTQDEDSRLTDLVESYGNKNWKKIADLMISRNPVQCLHRWSKILQPGLIKGPWTVEEDRKLIGWVKRHGPMRWSMCCEFIPGRSGKQCRERWYNNLNPEVVKGNWTTQEDYMIFKLFSTIGSKWSKIAEHFHGRTENAIKNRFYSTLRRISSKYKNGRRATTNLEELMEFFPIAMKEREEEMKKEIEKNEGGKIEIEKPEVENYENEKTIPEKTRDESNKKEEFGDTEDDEFEDNNLLRHQKLNDSNNKVFLSQKKKRPLFQVKEKEKFSFDERKKIKDILSEPKRKEKATEQAESKTTNSSQVSKEETLMLSSISKNSSPYSRESMSQQQQEYSFSQSIPSLETAEERQIEMPQKNQFNPVLSPSVPPSYNLNYFSYFNHPSESLFQGQYNNVINRNIYQQYYYNNVLLNFYKNYLPPYKK